MPSVTVFVDPSVARYVDRYFEDHLGELIKRTVAVVFELKKGLAAVGVKWDFPRDQNNESPLVIEVAYNETDDFCPTQAMKDELGERLSNLVNEYHDMPAEISEISAAVRPHPGGVFKTAKRQK